MIKTYNFTAREELYRTYDLARLRAAHADAFDTLKLCRKSARDAEFKDPQANAEEGYYTDDCCTITKIIAEKLAEVPGAVSC